VVNEVHPVADLASCCIEPGYEDLNDHDEQRHVITGKLAAKRADYAPLAGKSTLNRASNLYQSAECLTLAWRERIPESAIA
jgi:hypothetical protein